MAEDTLLDPRWRGYLTLDLDEYRFTFGEIDADVSPREMAEADEAERRQIADMPRREWPRPWWLASRRPRRLRGWLSPSFLRRRLRPRPTPTLRETLADAVLRDTPEVSLYLNMPWRDWHRHLQGVVRAAYAPEDTPERREARATLRAIEVIEAGATSEAMGSISLRRGAQEEP